MKKILKDLYSSRATVVLFLIFIVGIGVATFIEEAYDTATAKRLVYNARWLEVVFVLLAINFIGHISRYKMISKEKFPGLVFHLAFIVMILGACITRYIGYEGMMHIREGNSSNILFTSQTFLQIETPDNVKYSKPVNSVDGTFKSIEIKNDNNEKTKISFKRYIANAVPQIVENIEEGKPIIRLMITSGGNSEIVILKYGEKMVLSNFSVAFGENNTPSSISISKNNDELLIKSSLVLNKVKFEESEERYSPDSAIVFEKGFEYMVGENMISLSQYYKNALMTYRTLDSDRRMADVMIVEVEKDGKKMEYGIVGGQAVMDRHIERDIFGINYKMAFGEIPLELPFSLYLKDFILDRYAGSMSPSSFASEVVVIDDRNGLKMPHRIFMNNVLDYDGFRFFQSSYDKDEKGTILSVSHDFIGARTTYFGYFLLGLGLLLTLFNRNSRFFHVIKKIKEYGEERKNISMSILILITSLFTFSDLSAQKKVDTEHADKFGNLISQTYGGRFEPLHSLAIDVVHKISRKDGFNLKDKGKMDCMDAFLDMMIDPEYWKSQKIIYISNKSLRSIIGVRDKYASFYDFFDDKGVYKLSEMASNAFRKGAEQTKLDKEVLKVDERVNIFYLVLNGSMLKIFPDFNSKNHDWVSWDENTAKNPLSGSFAMINQDLKLPVLNYENILQLYITELKKATITGNYSKVNKIVGYIDGIQRHTDMKDVIPDKTKVKFEVFYNKANIFTSLKKWYSYLSLILLILAFADTLKNKKGKTLTYLLNFFIVLQGAAFLYHTFGMGLRWYLSGHAPWANAYETLLFISWGSILAGFIFVRFTKIALAATTLMGFLSLMVAGLNSYDPQLTNLQPVLKSYWLIIHVASMAISYCFLGLGFILGLINMFIYLFKNKLNVVRLNIVLKELTYINELNLIIGLVLATAGTFLGAIWANESWGRYWGWDAKETWALIIVLAYTLILHLRLIPGAKGRFLFNMLSVLTFSTVLMTFIGVNYYLSNGMHSYAGGGDTPVFPVWAWIVILSVFALIIAAYRNELKFKEKK